MVFALIREGRTCDKVGDLDGLGIFEDIIGNLDVAVFIDEKMHNVDGRSQFHVLFSCLD